MMKRPGGELSSRPLHFIWIADCSGSMGGDKIQQLNFAIRESIPDMQKVADENPNAEVLVRAIKFADTSQWHIANQTAVADFKWTDLNAGGETHMGEALQMVADQLKIPPMTDRGLPPVLVLITDGQPTDDFEKGLKSLMAQPWGQKAVRVAIAIGQDADDTPLQKFIGNSEIPVLRATNPQALVHYIKWASTVPLQAASSPPSVPDNTKAPVGNVPIPAPVAMGAGVQAKDVW